MSGERVTRLLGHPLHAALTDFPIALLVVASVFDAVSWYVGDPAFALVAYWCELLGLVAAAVAAAVGVADLVRLESPSAAMTTALLHAGVAAIAITFYTIAFVLRTPGATPIAVIALELVGFAFVGVTGWFGGHLVFHHGVGVSAKKQ
jgi:uncharacterized membrane protein